MLTFVTVVDCNSFTVAARKLESSKPAVSRQIADLESRLGYRLLNRTTRSFSLASEGQRFYAHCKEILNAIELAEAELASTTAQASGLLRLSAPLSFGILELAPLWPKYLKSQPNVQLDIELTDRQVDVIDNGFDLVIRIASLTSSSLISKKLANTQLLLAASPKYLKQHGRPKSPDDLINHEVVKYSYAPSKNEWNLIGPEGPVTTKVSGRITANNGDAARILALNHQGIILQPSFIIGNDIKVGTLETVLPGWRGLDLGIYAIYPSRRHLSAKVRTMIDFLAEHFKSRQWG
jgi:DNA-binding transcriptional LysR family regulator